MPYFKNPDTPILFIHVPKTGGTSLEDYFSRLYNVPLNRQSLFGFDPNINTSSLQHLTIKTIVQHRNYLNVADHVKIIAIVRNPYERVVSDLFFLKRISADASKEEVFKKLQAYVVAKKVDNHNLPQAAFLTDENNVLVPTIYLVRTESLTADMHALGYSDFDTHSNANAVKVDYYTYLNAASIQLINEVYADDFKLFHYPLRKHFFQEAID